MSGQSADSPGRLSAGRGWAYAGVIVGGGLSVAANWQHALLPRGQLLDRVRAAQGVGDIDLATALLDRWSPPAFAVIMSIAWPLLLVMCIEVLMRNTWPRGWWWWLVRIGSCLPVAGVAAVMSYLHMSGLLAYYGQSGAESVYGPLAIDGMVIMCSAALFASRPGRRRPRTVHLPRTPAVDSAQTVPVSLPRAVGDDSPSVRTVPDTRTPQRPKVVPIRTVPDTAADTDVSSPDADSGGGLSASLEAAVETVRDYCQRRDIHVAPGDVPKYSDVQAALLLATGTKPGQGRTKDIREAWRRLEGATHEH